MTSWNCTHCNRTFYGPVSLQLGQRSCYYHPGNLVIMELGFCRQFSCCGAPQHSAKYERGCSPIEHLPRELFDLLSPQGDLIVPSFILPTQQRCPTLKLGDSSLLTEWQKAKGGNALKQYLSNLIRADKHYWATLPSPLFKQINLRADQRRLIHASSSMEAQVLTWAPYQPLPEAPPIIAASLANKKTVSQKREEEEQRQKMVRAAHYLCMSPHEELAARPPLITSNDNSSSLVEAMIAEELKSVPIEWTVLKCI